MEKLEKAVNKTGLKRLSLVEVFQQILDSTGIVKKMIEYFYPPLAYNRQRNDDFWLLQISKQYIWRIDRQSQSRMPL